uniref:BED-type domain-containing protein n=1 Tax=Chenopodium quinoa TaxID=63459 RepID=A0A803LJG0_CHEQI
MYGLTELSNIRQLEFGLTECMESGSSGDMEDSSTTSQAPPIPSPPPEPWEYDPCPMTENNDPFDQQNQSNQPSEPADAAAPLSETSKKSRKRRFPHWEHFIKKDGENKAECIYCHTFISCASLQGTSGMKNHIKRCRLELWKFNQEDSRRALAKMVIMDEMSFRMVEHEDNASSNDVGIQYLKRRFESWKTLVLGGRFLHMRCCAHILSLTVKEGLKESDVSIKRIRCAVRYVRSSGARLQKFMSCVKQEKLESKRFLCLDVDTRWNSTFLMLEGALAYRRAFDLLECSDGGKFRYELLKTGGVPEPSDWDCVASFLPLLKIFYDATLRVSGSLYITSNVNLQELVGISVLIKKKMLSNDAGVSLMASGMKKKHDKYWENVDNVNLLLYIAVILDPRRKMGYTKWAINQQYDSEKAKYLCDKVMQTLNDMYELYISENPPNKSKEDMDSDVDVAELEFERQVGSCAGVQGKNELAKYLEDDREVNPAGKSFDCPLIPEERLEDMEKIESGGSLDKNIIKQVGTRRSSGSQVGEVRMQQPQGQGLVGCQSGRQR